MKQFRKLMEPGKIGGLELKNRIVMAPMVTRYAGDSGEVTQRMVDYYQERARGGVGLIVTEAVYFCEGGNPGRLSIYDDEFMPGLRWLLEKIEAAGCKAAIELNPGRGRKDEVQPVCASNVPPSPYIPGPSKGQEPRVLTIEEIELLIGQFGQAAKRAKDIGFHALMLHGAAAYLVMDFLSPLTNQRTDEYGGDIKARAKLALRLMESARRAVGEDFPILFRMTVDQHVEGGFSLSDAIVVCQMLEKAGCSAIDVISGSYAAPEWAIPPMPIRGGCNADMSAAVKAAVNIPVMVAGKINDPSLAEEILEQGKADFVDLGRALIADPKFPEKVYEKRTDDIRRCLCCNVCYQTVVSAGSALRCTVNPEVGRENAFRIAPTGDAKKVLVIGGGPGGMEAARVAALRGHEVTLWEKHDGLGGQLRLASVPPHKEPIGELMDYLGVQVQKAGVRVELERESTFESVIDFEPDAVIVATGAKPLIPEISGIQEQEKKVVLAQDLLAGRKEAGATVVIIGGELVGCETGEFLAEQGKQVVITTLLSEMATNLPMINRSFLLRSLENKGILMVPSVRYESVTEDGINIVDGEGKRKFLKAETIVIAAGFVPDDGLFRSLKHEVKECYAIGDCVQPRNILEAIGEAAEIARKI